MNDLGGTLMNESISRAAGASHGQEMPPELMEEAIRAAGRVAAAADDAVRHAAGRSRRRVVRRAAARRAAQPAGRHGAPAPPEASSSARALPSPEDARVARLATVDPQRPAARRPDLLRARRRHALHGCRREAEAHAPRSSASANIEANPHVEVLIDHYEDDWSRLWWVRLRGHGADRGRSARRGAARRQVPAVRASGRPPDR